jgi:isoquinoline 1-oxidoreductase alpha subunit
MELIVNGSKHEVEIEPDTPLLWVLRDELGMTGTKYGCGVAQCGACTVLVDGQATRSCVTSVESVSGARIMTIEAIEDDPVGRKLVDAWVAEQAPQCGYCQSGQVMAAAALLKQNARPSDADIAAAMVNFCRCGAYNAIAAAVRRAAGAQP